MKYSDDCPQTPLPHNYRLRLLSGAVLLAVATATTPAYALNYVAGGGEFTNTGVINLGTSTDWQTERAATPGYFAAVGSATYSNGSDTNNINGYVKHYVNAAGQGFSFPVGSGSDLRMLQTSGAIPDGMEVATAWIAGDPTTTTDPTAPAAGNHDITAVGTEIQAVSPAGQWDWQDLSATAAGVTVTVSIPDMSTFGSASLLRLVGWDGSQWINLSGTSGATGNTEDSTLSGTLQSGITALGIGLSSIDSDNDGLSDADEETLGTDPANPDSDGDGLFDGFEVGGDPTNPRDTDGDGNIDALDNDDDDDGILTQYEEPDANGDGDPADARDTDGDGVPDYRDADDDGDGTPTVDENTDPNGDGNPDDAGDMDGDGIPDHLDDDEVPTVILQLRAILQGAYDGTTGLMRDDLRNAALIPSTQPYSDLNYAGTETVAPGVLAATGNDAAVDWVLVELRDATDWATRLSAKAAIVQSDGDIVDAASGLAELRFPNMAPGNYQVAISHRNHLGIVTDTAWSLSAVPEMIDFTLPATAVLGADARQLSGTVATLWSGETDLSNTVIAAGPGNDPNNLLSAVLLDPDNTGLNANYNLSGYLKSDINMDGVTQFAGPGNDVTLILGNVLLHPQNDGGQTNFILLGQQPARIVP